MMKMDTPHRDDEDGHTQRRTWINPAERPQNEMGTVGMHRLHRARWARLACTDCTEQGGRGGHRGTAQSEVGISTLGSGS